MNNPIWRSTRRIKSLNMPFAGRSFTTGWMLMVTPRIPPAWFWSVIAVTGLLLLASCQPATSQPAVSQATEPAQATQTTSVELAATNTPTTAATFPPPTPTQVPSPTAIMATPTFNPSPVEQHLTTIKGDEYSASFSPNGEKVVFVSNYDNDYDIYIMDADGANQVRLTNTPEERKDSASFTPDGKKIIFISANDIYLMDVDGANVVNLTNTADINEGAPTFINESPLVIVFHARKAKDSAAVRSIYTGVIEGNQLTGITKIRANSNFDYYTASIIPGTDILVHLQLGINAHSTQLIRYDMDTRQEEIISGSYTVYHPRVSPDGKWIFFRSVLDHKSLALRVSTADWSIAEVPVNFADFNGQIAISPDNQWLIFSVKQENNYTDLYRLSFP